MIRANNLIIKVITGRIITAVDVEYQNFRRLYYFHFQ